MISAQKTITSLLGCEKWAKIERIALSRYPDKDRRIVFYRDIITEAYERKTIYRWIPVSFEEFVLSPYYLNKAREVYPEVLKSGKELNSGKYHEAVLTGGIGSAKTTLAVLSLIYGVYVLSCMRSPHSFFGLDEAHEIITIVQSINKSTAKDVGFDRIYNTVAGSRYFSEVFPFDRSLKAKIVFPNRIEIKPVAGDVSATIGQNVFQALLDEVNFMQVIRSSKKSVTGGEYDQAWALYNSISMRRKTRFIKGGKTYGMLCLVSSKRYPGQFTDIKVEQANGEIEKNGRTGIFVYDKRVWDIKPAGTYSDNPESWFWVFTGDDSRSPAILSSEKEVERFSEEDRKNLIVIVPIEYLDNFERNPLEAIRDIAGVSTVAKSPFIQNVERLAACFCKSHRSVFSVQSAVLGSGELELVKDVIDKAGKYPRWCHIDLSKNGCSTGLVIGGVDRFVRVNRGLSSEIEILPHIVIDGALEIKPPRFGEIDYEKIRNVLYSLRDMGLPIKWVTFDQYQSVDSQQILRSKGFICGEQSMDRLPVTPYKIAHAAIYDNRVLIPEHKLLFDELRGLEFDCKTGKVDHASTFSKDLADAAGAVIYRLSTRREIWTQHGVTNDQIPDRFRQ